MAKRCGNCGSKNLVEVKNAGPFKWRDFPSVQLVKPVPTLKCADCGETLMPLGAGAAIDKMIEEAISDNVRMFIARVIERESAMQMELSTRLGVTPEYLSEIKSGRKLPSFQTYNFLKVLALDEKAYKLSDPSDKTA